MTIWLASFGKWKVHVSPSVIWPLQQARIMWPNSHYFLFNNFKKIVRIIVMHRYITFFFFGQFLNGKKYTVILFYKTTSFTTTTINNSIIIKTILMALTKVFQNSNCHENAKLTIAFTNSVRSRFSISYCTDFQWFTETVKTNKT